MRVRYQLATALLASLAVAAGEPAVAAGQTAWQPSPGHTQIPIWPGVPNAQSVEGSEVSGTVVDAAGSSKLVGGKPWVYVAKVSQPTMTVYSPENSLAYHAALRKAGVPVEMHLYAKGGHAFGLRRTSAPITGWPELVENWLGTIGMISK
jgi:acetyl esterase/lipase